MTWHVSGGTNRFRRARRAQATASVAAGMGWLTCATAAGPFGSPMLDLWLMGSGLFAASWNIRQIMRNAHDETEQVEDKGGFAKIAEAIGLEKLRVKKAQGNGKGMVEVPVEIPPSQTIADVQAALPKLATAAQIPPSGATVKGDLDNAANATLYLRVADLLKDGVQFVPPVRMGLLPNEPIPLGLYADGEYFVINPFDADILQHLLVMGVTGAGKSEFARGLIAHLSTRRKLTMFVADCSKGRQSMGHIADGIDWFLTQPREVKHLFKALPGAIKARGDVLADEGLDQWTPESSLNAMVLWLEEAADLTDFDELDQIARAARSVGIWLVVSLQRAVWTNINVNVRTNLQAAACFGVDDAGDAGFCLPDRVVEAGAVPDWGSDRPGYAFATGMGIDQDRWTMEWRSGLTDRKYLAALVEAGAAHRDPLDGVTAAALGAAYEQRTHRGTNRINPARSALAPAFPLPPVEDEDDTVSMEIDDVRTEVLGMIPGDPEPDADYAGIDLDGPLPEVPADAGMTFEQRERPGAEAARRVIHEQIASWLTAGQLEFQPADLAPAAVSAGRKRAWLQAELKRLVEEGVIRRDGHGEYSILRAPLVAA
ncbi:FtsK/SpoIIIE domain-containing protein [Streptomyces ziwulingensis]|uniref:FtsK/SpoIIIE domain-containing protein n=1 Tax=Streptomyces ziwulingensis TaxID=1045501 RepID=UPI0031EF5F12